MIITNIFNIPRPFYEAIKRMSWKPNPDRLYVTQLAQPPMIRRLTIKHWDELEVDASDFFYRLFGQAIHHVLEEGAKDLPDVVVEKSYVLPKELFGIEISMRVDWIEGTPYVLVAEAKTAGVMSIANGVKDDWIYQTNVYRYAINKVDGVLVKRLKAFVLLRDWIPSKVRENGYPKTPFVELDIPVLPLETVEQWIRERVACYLQDPVPLCTKEEKWQAEDSFAVMEKGKVKALAATIVGPDGGRIGIPSQEEAEKIIYQKGLTKEYERGKVYIQRRVGEPRHCMYYCDVRNICKKVNGEKI